MNGRRAAVPWPSDARTRAEKGRKRGGRPREPAAPRSQLTNTDGEPVLLVSFTGPYVAEK